MADPKDYDDGVEAVHRAFCDPENEAVGPWDREMADALHRNGLAIVSVEDVARRLYLDEHDHDAWDKEFPEVWEAYEQEARRLLGVP